MLHHVVKKEPLGNNKTDEIYMESLHNITA